MRRAEQAQGPSTRVPASRAVMYHWRGDSSELKLERFRERGTARGGWESERGRSATETRHVSQKLREESTDWPRAVREPHTHSNPTH
eukprot:scaffold1351_cov359-Prasinococcus_capsulatus_cf.AAC.9